MPYLKIRIDEIREQGLTLSAQEQIADYPALLAVEKAGECQFLAPLEISLTVIREFDHIRASGEVGTAVRLACSRCLAVYDAAISSAFTIFYTKASAALQQDEEVELAEQDLVSATYAGDEIDFAPEIAEQVALEIPFKPLCKEDCKGLCAVCGVDLNAVACGCDKQEVSLKFNALQGFKVDR